MTKFQTNLLKRSKKYKNPMGLKEKIKNIFGPKLKLLPGTRLTSFLFIGVSILIAGAILFAANIYYNLDTGEIVMEEVQRAARVIKATAGLIIGDADSLPSGVALEIATTSNVRLSGEGQALIFTGGTSNYIGIRAPDSFNYSLIYKLPAVPPSSNAFVLTSDTSGQLSWSSVSGVGGIVQVGDALGQDTGGLAFVSQPGTQYGNILWFHPNANYTMALMGDSSLDSNATTILPAVSGTNYLTLTQSQFTSNRLLMATGNYTMGSVSNLVWVSGDNALEIGTTNARGQLRLYSNSPYYLAFTPTTGLDVNVTYTWPKPPSSSGGYVLTTDTSGNLSWALISGEPIGGVTGSGEAGYVAFWNSTSSITYDTSFAWNAADNILTIGGTIIGNTIRAQEFTGPVGATTTIKADQSIILDPTSGKIILGANDWIETSQGYQIGKSNTEILREIIPIMGFDLPIRCGNTCNSATTVSRTIEAYPFSSAQPGTDRIHKFIIRYADQGATASSTWIVWDEDTNQAVATFTVPYVNTSLDKGMVYITQDVTIPTDHKWHLRMQTPSGMTIQVYQIFLAAYDKIK